MTPRLLIDAIVQQTTVLIAQLSTAAGLRSPLAHVADQVFLSLAKEIERQGVGRKVVADMFGLALRSYQRKVQRLEDGGHDGQTLWERIHALVAERGPVDRRGVIARFKGHDELAVIAVLNDLVSSGLIYSSGRGAGSVYGVTSEADQKVLDNQESIEALATLLWGIVFRSPGISTRGLLGAIRASEVHVRQALTTLLSDGRVTRDADSDDSPLHSSTFIIETGTPQGWEAAVFDHYQALANAVVDKLQRRANGGGKDDSVGGTTLHFGIRKGHEYEARVLGLLQKIRSELFAFWDEVSEHNRKNPFPDEEATRVTFYFGQSVTAPAEPSTGTRDDDDAKTMERTQ